MLFVEGWNICQTDVWKHSHDKSQISSQTCQISLYQKIHVNTNNTSSRR